ncbi:methyltransferase domain-containing protein [Yinghuangia soli]|uniref:Methyltransferase domain-containing protein n=1 Tax=Yinghuangia soli TaxID=2908204 RepID=A0AA41Q441_9ACTN|nr:methyltransferase domain-containing protein [Yinghuangia soli]MCF2531190.1 methyltransferase domain-containing protein [Yinghuangia soli]
MISRIPVSVWGTGDMAMHSLPAEHGYGVETASDPARIPPGIAAEALSRYTPPQGRLLDPDCGSGVALVEALRLGRHAVGATRSPRWWRVARNNVNAAKFLGAGGDGMVLEPTDSAPALLGESIDLVLTAVRTFATEPGATAHLIRTLRWCRPVLRPGGVVVLVAPPRRRSDVLLDLPNCMYVAGQSVGLRPVERAIAVTAELRGDQLVAHASLPQRRFAERQARRLGRKSSVPAHWDVAVFVAPKQQHRAAAPSLDGVAPGRLIETFSGSHAARRQAA